MKRVGLAYFALILGVSVFASWVAGYLPPAKAQTTQEPELISGTITTTLTGTVISSNGTSGIVNIFPGQHIVIRLDKK